MRQRVLKVFDREVDTTGSNVFGELAAEYQAELGLHGSKSDKQFNDALGLYDELGLVAEVTNVSSGSGVTFDLYIDTSSDGIYWLPARNQANQTPPFHTNPGDITLLVSSTASALGYFTVAGTGVTRATGTPIATGPLLHYVRLFLKISSGTAHVRVHAFQRDLK